MTDYFSIYSLILNASRVVQLVIGILKEEGSTGWQNPDDDLYVPLLTASQRIFGTDRLGWINVGISNETNVDYVMMTIEQILRQKHDIGPGGDNDFRINDWSQYSDLRRQATGIFYRSNCWHSWYKFNCRWNWCYEYNACISYRKNS